MVHITDDFRLKVNLACGILLVAFIGGVVLLAAIMAGWLMALGMSIVFVLEFIKRKQSNS